MPHLRLPWVLRLRSQTTCLEQPQSPNLRFAASVGRNNALENSGASPWPSDIAIDHRRFTNHACDFGSKPIPISNMQRLSFQESLKQRACDSRVLTAPF